MEMALRTLPGLLPVATLCSAQASFNIPSEGPSVASLGRLFQAHCCLVAKTRSCWYHASAQKLPSQIPWACGKGLLPQGAREGAASSLATPSIFQPFNLPPQPASADPSLLSQLSLTPPICRL